MFGIGGDCDLLLNFFQCEDDVFGYTGDENYRSVSDVCCDDCPNPPSKICSNFFAVF